MPKSSRSLHCNAFGVQGELEGTYIIHKDSLEVYLVDAKIYVSEHCPYQGRSSINYLTIGLAASTGIGLGKKIESEAQPVSLGFVMRPREEQSIGLQNFVIPRDGTNDLSKCWLVVKIQTDALDDFSEKPGSGFVFASSGRRYLRLAHTHTLSVLIARQPRQLY